MELQRFSDAGAMLARVGDFLAAHEAANCLQIGVLTTRSQATSAHPMYGAAVIDGGEIRAVATLTPPYDVIITRDAPAEAVELIARDLAGESWDFAGVSGDAATSQHFAQTWLALTGRGFALSARERIYQLVQVVPVVGVAGQMRGITEADRPLLQVWLADFEREAHGMVSDLALMNGRIDRYMAGVTAGMYLWEVAGAAVALAGHSGPTPRGMRVGPVYTPPGERGHGYASALVAALSQMLLDGGRQFCFLYTDLANPTSNHIYQTIGYTAVCDVRVYTFT